MRRNPDFKWCHKGCFSVLNGKIKIATKFPSKNTELVKVLAKTRQCLILSFWFNLQELGKQVLESKSVCTSNNWPFWDPFFCCSMIALGIFSADSQVMATRMWQLQRGTKKSVAKLPVWRLANFFSSRWFCLQTSSLILNGSDKASHSNILGSLEIRFFF